MSTYSLSHLSDQNLLHDLATLISRDRVTTAALLAHLGEVDARKLYLPAAYPSMYAYCVGELHMSEETACRRIRAARAARDFPAIFAAVADGRLHLSAVVLLAPYLTAENAIELHAAAALKSKSEIERLLADRFPRPDVPTRIQAIPSPAGQPIGKTGGPTLELPSPVTVNFQPPALGPVAAAPGIVEPALGRTDPPVARPRVAPLAPQRFSLQLTMSQRMHDKLRHAQSLLSHRVPAGDVAAVLELVLDTAIEQLEKRKFAATSRPRDGQKLSTANGRYVPAPVRRAVWRRDGGQCTFVSDTGRRCSERSWLEFDHVTEFARGGQATISGMRLRCRAHNQFGAECTYGNEFMRRKREAHRATPGSPARHPALTAKPRVDAPQPNAQSSSFRIGTNALSPTGSE